MTKTTFQFEFKDFKISASQIEKVLGYQEGEDREIVRELIEVILKESEDLCNIKAQYSIFHGVHFNNEAKSIEINSIRFNVKKIVFGQIKKSESIAIFLCTAGKEIGMRSRIAMQERDLLKGYIYDVVGSLMVEASTDLIQERLEIEMVAAGNKITNRYSPGYCGWDVAEQHKLFQLVPDNFCGIRLTESALMDPVKSISGIIGIGENVIMNPYTCSLCALKDCSYRKVREKQA